MPRLLVTVAGWELMGVVPPDPLLLLSRRESWRVKAGKER